MSFVFLFSLTSKVRQLLFIKSPWHITFFFISLLKKTPNIYSCECQCNFKDSIGTIFSKFEIKARIIAKYQLIDKLWFLFWNVWRLCLTVFFSLLRLIFLHNLTYNDIKVKLLALLSVNEALFLTDKKLGGKKICLKSPVLFFFYLADAGVWSTNNNWLLIIIVRQLFSYLFWIHGGTMHLTMKFGIHLTNKFVPLQYLCNANEHSI